MRASHWETGRLDSRSTRDELPQSGVSARAAGLTVVLAIAAALWDQPGWPIGILSLGTAGALLLSALLTRRRRGDRTDATPAEQRRFEALLADALHAVSVAPAGGIGAEIERWVSQAAAAVGADGALVARLDGGGRMLIETHRWAHHPAGLSPVRSRLRLGALELERLKRGELVSIGMSDDRPLAGFSGVMVPLVVGGKTWGALTLVATGDAVRWENGRSERARVLAEVLACAITRRRGARALAARNAALRESEARYRQLAGRFLKAQEDERRRIARELHDDFSQRLAVAGLEADRAGRTLEESAETARAALRDLANQLSELQSDVSRLSHQLHPAMLSQVGLAPALRALSRSMTTSTGFTVSFTEHHVPAELSADVSLALYRVAQEALRNAVKHARVTQAFVQIGFERGELTLEIVDRGVGFDSNGVHAHGGLGLASMAERIQIIGGVLAIRSAPGVGTAVTARVPLAPVAPAPDAARLIEEPTGCRA